ncbi:unnamed protein product [Closterium sp. NIES-64]|nr:unnamed protein product [Closterium sp. NIES-64]
MPYASHVLHMCFTHIHGTWVPPPHLLNDLLHRVVCRAGVLSYNHNKRGRREGRRGEEKQGRKREERRKREEGEEREGGEGNDVR